MLRDGRMPDSFQFLALAVMALGLGGVLAGLLILWGAHELRPASKG